VNRLPLPLGCIDAVVESLDDNRVLVRWSDAVLGQLVEAEATLDQLAEWQHDGGPPASLIIRRQWLETAKADAEAALAETKNKQEAMRRTWHGVAEGEWFDTARKSVEGE
jgi:hypothetical protein